MSQNTQPFFPIGTIGTDWIHNPQLLLKCLTLQKQTDQWFHRWKKEHQDILFSFQQIYASE